MPDIPTHITVQIDLDQQGFVEVLESAIRYAFEQGYQAGARPRPNVTMDAYYQDWRGWGPGATLPGGNRFRAAVEDAERMRKLQLDAPLITAVDWMDRVDRRIDEAARRAATAEQIQPYLDIVIGDRVGAADECVHAWTAHPISDTYCTKCGAGWCRDE